MTEQQQEPKPVPTREDFDRAHRIFASNGHSCECGPRQGEWFTCDECRAAETIKAYADAKEAEIVALREALRDMEIARWEAVKEFREHLRHYDGKQMALHSTKELKILNDSIKRCDDKIAQLRADAVEGGR